MTEFPAGDSARVGRARPQKKRGGGKENKRIVAQSGPGRAKNSPRFGETKILGILSASSPLRLAHAWRHQSEIDSNIFRGEGGGEPGPFRIFRLEILLFLDPLVSLSFRETTRGGWVTGNIFEVVSLNFFCLTCSWPGRLSNNVHVPLLNFDARNILNQSDLNGSTEQRKPKKEARSL